MPPLNELFEFIAGRLTIVFSFAVFIFVFFFSSMAQAGKWNKHSTKRPVGAFVALWVNGKPNIDKSTQVVCFGKVKNTQPGFIIFI